MEMIMFGIGNLGAPFVPPFVKSMYEIIFLNDSSISCFVNEELDSSTPGTFISFIALVSFPASVSKVSGSF